MVEAHGLGRPGSRLGAPRVPLQLHVQLHLHLSTTITPRIHILLCDASLYIVSSPKHIATLYIQHMAQPPRVPPKDTMEIENQKRKRDLTISEDEPSPKRQRSPLPQSDFEADDSDDATPAQPNIRRKKGSRNLSTMNLRHASEKQENAPQQKGTTAPKKKSRKSRFIEGSLTDKPSTKPPSMFMRFIRTDSGNIRQVTEAQEELMDDYHNGAAQPLDFVDKVIAQERADIPSRVAQIEAEKENKSEAGAFGKWASSFHPVSLWNKVFAQTREEIIREDFEEAERKALEEAERKAREEVERKAKEKADFEARYFEMKAAGMFKPKYLGPITKSDTGSFVSRSSALHAPRDSGIVIDDDLSGKDPHDDSRSTSLMSGMLKGSQEYERSTSQMSGVPKDSREHQRSGSQMSGVLATPQDDTTSASEAPETATKAAKTLKSRLHLKKPSLTNIQGSLKRAKSEWSLTSALHHRESSSSLSPVKTDFENSALKKSQSKYDLKKQNKLSKRVSDLETKLSQARKELDEALVEASPIPKIGNRYERFTPQSTLKRPKFIPGTLPSLPSERILMAEQQEQNMKTNMEVKRDEDMGYVEAIDNTDLKEFLAEAQVKRHIRLNKKDDTEDSDEEGEETIKARASHNRCPYPTRASSLFSLNNIDIEKQTTTPAEPNQPAKSTRSPSLFTLNNANIEEHPADSAEPTEPARPEVIIETQPHTSELTEPTSSRVDDMDPNSITHAATNGAVDQTNKSLADYAALDVKLKALDANVKKAAKAKKPANKIKKRKSAGDQMDKEYKPGKGMEEETSEIDEDRTPKKKRKSLLGLGSSPNNKKARKTSPPKKGKKKNAEFEVYDDPSPRGSFESAQGRPLEAVPEEAEEEEEEIVEETGVIAGAEEMLFTRAAEAAKSNRASIDEPVRVIPGEQGVPALPNGKTTSEEEELDEFKWPGDCF